MNSKNKVLLIFPPVAPPVSPYLSTPLLAGQLKKAGYEVSILDLSVEFFNYILNSKFINKSYQNSKNKYEKLLISIGDKSSSDEIFSTYSKKLQSNIMLKEYFEKIFKDEEQNIEIINNLSEYVKSYKNPDIFYNPKKMNLAYSKVEKAFVLSMLDNFPETVFFNKYDNLLYKNNISGIYKQINKNNIFTQFYKDKIREFNVLKYDLICFSCPNSTQIIPTLMLSKMIKEYLDIKIVIGGNIISRVDDELTKMPDLYDNCFDYILTGCGEKSIVHLANYLFDKTKKISLKSIKGLIYKQNNKIYKNTPDYSYNINESAPICFDGLNLKKYYTPDIIMPIQTSKGCYWGKCVFCGLHCPPKKYTVKKQKLVVDEIEYLNKTFGIKYFEFVDESIQPNYLLKLADEIIKRKLDIKYVCCARLEAKYFTDENCSKLNKSGLSIIELGYETASKRVYNSINKGVKFENRDKILSNFVKNDIYTYVYSIVGYPNETIEEANETINLIDEYKDIIDLMFIHRFFLDKKSPAFKKYKEIGISNIYENRNDIFDQNLKFKRSSNITNDDILNLYKKYLKTSIFTKLNFYTSDEYLFLYVFKYGRKTTKQLFNAILKECK